MDAKTYVKNVLVTEARDFTPVQDRLMEVRNIRLLHASAGISSEIAELVQLNEKSWDGKEQVIDRVNLMEECGDILWYVGIACDALVCTEAVTREGEYREKTVKHDDDLSSNLFAVTNRLADFAGIFADFAVKKFIFYGKPFNSEPLVEQLTNIHSTVKYLLEMSGYTLEDARERNIAKLKARYGAKFTEAAALERNLEAERAILEGE